MRAGGDLGHHAAEAGVLVDAGRDLVGQQLRRAAVAADDADAGLVARGLDAEHDHRLGVPPHGVRVGAAGRVVAPAQADHREALGLVERVRGLVVGAHLEEDGGVRGVGDREQRPQQRPADAAALVGGVDADRVHLGLGSPAERRARRSRRASSSTRAAT